MIVGFTITDFKGHESEAIAFINRVCILEDSLIAKNIVEAGTGVNIFTRNLSLDDLKAQPFETEVIETQDNKLILVSTVNFRLELLYNGSILRLIPTEFIYIEPEEAIQFETYVSQGLVKILPDYNFDGSGNNWILRDSYWDDDGIWVDSELWED